MRGENTHGMRQNAENNHFGGLGGLRENRGRNGLKNPVGDPQSRGGGADSGEVWVELCRRGLRTLTLFKIKITHFATLLSDGSRGGARGACPPLSLDQIKN